MTRWATITIVLYFVTLVVLTLPVATLAGAIGLDPEMPSKHDIRDFLGVYALWQYYVALVVLTAIQAALLIVPVRSRKNIAIKQRHILAVLIPVALAAAVLVVAAMGSVLCIIFADSWPTGSELLLLGSLAGFWGFWFVIFRRFTKTTPAPDDWMRRITNWLYHASILELLVAVVAHIVVRRRGDCSAPLYTFTGMCLGIAIALLSFGPAVFYLFADRRRQMRPQDNPPAPPGA